MQRRSERTRTVTIRVLDAGEPVEEAELCPMRLPDGRLGARWRGQVFPVAEDGSIDIAGPFEVPEACRPWSETPPGPRWSLLEGAEEAVLFLEGDALVRDDALVALRGAGLAILRVAPALDPELEADWVIRLRLPEGGPPLRERVEAALGRVPAAPTEIPAPDRLRVRLLEAQIDRLIAERDRLRGELEALRRSRRSERPPDEEASRTALDRARARIDELQQALDRLSDENAALRRTLEESRRGSASSGTPAVERVRRRLRAELETFLAALPRIELVGDSLLSLLTDYRERVAVYRVLGELQAGVELQRRFKPVRGREGWWECHVSTGQGDGGRIYAFRAGERWRVLVSIKEAQQRDLDRLARLARPGP